MDHFERATLGVIKDMLVWIGKFHFPANFCMIDDKGKSNLPVILQRPFLATRNVVLNANNGTLNFYYVIKIKNLMCALTLKSIEWQKRKVALDTWKNVAFFEWLNQKPSVRDY